MVSVLPMYHLYHTDSLDLISGFRGILRQPFYSLLTKETKEFGFSEDKNIAHSVKRNAPTDILQAKLLKIYQNLYDLHHS